MNVKKFQHSEKHCRNNSKTEKKQKQKRVSLGVGQSSTSSCHSRYFWNTNCENHSRRKETLSTKDIYACPVSFDQKLLLTSIMAEHTPKFYKPVKKVTPSYMQLQKL